MSNKMKFYAIYMTVAVIAGLIIGVTGVIGVFNQDTYYIGASVLTAFLAIVGIGCVSTACKWINKKD